MSRTKQIIRACSCVLVILAIVAGVWIRQGLGPQPAPPPSPPSEARGPLAQRFPFLGDFSRGSWVGGVRDNRGALAPSSYFIRAYVVLQPEQTRALMTNYRWEESKEARIPQPGYPLGQGYPGIAGIPLKSDDLAKQLPSLTTYCRGVILLQPADNLLFLDLVND